MVLDLHIDGNIALQVVGSFFSGDSYSGLAFFRGLGGLAVFN